MARRRKYSPEVLASIPAMVDQGMKREEIAEQIGSTVKSLQVSCFRHGISMRKGGPYLRARQLGMSLVAPLPLHEKTLVRLRKVARSKGTDEVKLVSDLLNLIAKDDLFDAVLGDNKPLTTRRRTRLIRATPLSEGPQSAASSLIDRPERSTEIL